MPGSTQLDLGPIHHLAYVVEEIEPAVRRLHEQFGAGPFIQIEDATPEEVTSRGEPAVYVHGTAFGVCSGVAVELIQAGRIEPTRVAERFRLNDDGTPRLQHVAYAFSPPTVDEVRADLESRGLPEYLRARAAGDVEMTYHDASGTFGHDFEIHLDSASLSGFFGLVREAADGWDGSDLLRPFG
jgi:Glyoxalase/Bleomycin resistance protein/Dioxygenase superfamily